MLTPYQSEPYSDFSDPLKADAYAEALGEVAAHLGGERALMVIGDEHRDTKATIESVNPADPSQLVGTAASAGLVDVDAAIEAAWAAFGGWANVRAQALGLREIRSLKRPGLPPRREGASDVHRQGAG